VKQRNTAAAETKLKTMFSADIWVLICNMAPNFILQEFFVTWQSQWGLMCYTYERNNKLVTDNLRNLIKLIDENFSFSGLSIWPVPQVFFVMLLYCRVSCSMNLYVVEWTIHFAH
jgi:hypothetical protein